MRELGLSAVGRLVIVTMPHWIDLDGAANVRDVGGLPTDGGGTTAFNRLIRADNLQGLSTADIRRLVDEHGVRTIADLRTGVEVDSEGPGPMTREPAVAIVHLSLFPEAGRNTDVAAARAADAPVVLPWKEIEREKRESSGIAGVYLGYLDDRADSIIAALRLIAGSDGATIVHCAAGKDRTGTVVALALAEVGVSHEAIVADYAASADRITAVFARLRTSHTYADDIEGEDVAKHTPQAVSMQRLLEAMDEYFGGASRWLRDHGWTEQDAAALRAKLLS